jgi:hypothetical protein
MAITADQRATLQLLLERGKSYGDLAQLLGQPEDEVRARARGALTELGGADPDRNVGLTDYLLGQADPIGRADASRHLRDDRADYELAETLSQSLRELFPAATLPRLPGQPRPAGGGLLRRSQPPAPDAEPKRRGSGLSPAQTRLIVICASAAVIVIAAVLAITGTFGGGSDDEATAVATSTTSTSQGDEQIQQVALQPVSGGNASGSAIFGLATGDQPYVDVSIKGLDPAPDNKTYVIWLMLTGDKGYPLAPITVSENGTFSDRFPIPSAVLPIVARVQLVDVSIAPVSAIRKLVSNAIKSTALVVAEPGEVVLRGTIPKANPAPGQGGGQGSGGGGG